MVCRLTRTNDGILSIGSWSIWIKFSSKHNIQENAFENVVWKTAAILYRTQRVNSVAFHLRTPNIYWPAYDITGFADIPEQKESHQTTNNHCIG